MSYIKNTWQSGDLISTEKLNNIQNGIAAAASAGEGGGTDSSHIIYFFLDDLVARAESQIDGLFKNLFTDILDSNKTIQIIERNEEQGSFTATWDINYSYYMTQGDGSIFRFQSNWLTFGYQSYIGHFSELRFDFDTANGEIYLITKNTVSYNFLNSNVSNSDQTLYTAYNAV